MVWQDSALPVTWPVRAFWSRFEPSSDEQKKLVDSFLQAVVTGDIEGLTEMLTEDVVFFGDGGGKVSAVRRPITGREAVKRFLWLAICRLLPPEVRLDVAEVNGSPAILLWGHDHHPYFVMTFTITGNKIQADPHSPRRQCACWAFKYEPVMISQTFRSATLTKCN